MTGFSLCDSPGFLLKIKHCSLVRCTASALLCVNTPVWLHAVLSLCCTCVLLQVMTIAETFQQRPTNVGAYLPTNMCPAAAWERQPQLVP